MPMYKALLKWSLAQTDGTSGPSTAMPMTDEKRKFLAAAMESYVLDETKRMHDILIILKYKQTSTAAVACDHSTTAVTAVDSTTAAVAVDSTTAATAVDSTATATAVGAAVQPPKLPSPISEPTALSYSQIVAGAVAARVTQQKQETTFIVDSLATIPVDKLIKIKVDALRELSERVEQIDNATYFACGAGDSGELPLLFSLIKGGVKSLQAEACNVLKIIIQNNPKCQTKALKIGGMNVLLLVTQTHPEMEMRVKAFSCLSALLRYCGNAIPILAFANAGGLEKCVMPALTNNKAPRLQKKALFFLQYVVSADDSFAATRFAASGIARALGVLLASKDDDIVEQSATILNLLLQNTKGLEVNMKCLQDTTLKVKEHLKTHLLSISAKPAEEREYYIDMENILKKLYVTLCRWHTHAART